MLQLYALVFAASLAATVPAIWLLCRLAPRLGLVDHPEGRKAHQRSTPLIGGLAIVAGAALALVFIMIQQGEVSALFSTFRRHTGFFCGVILLLVMGLIDDRRPIAARWKLLIQLFCCTLAVFIDGAVVGEVGIWINNHLLSLGPMKAPFTVLVMLTITNAMNMIDGADGLSGGIMLMALLVIAKAVATAGFSSTPYVIALIGALSAFLLFNFPLLPGQKARAFLGDAGSLVFGFALAYMAIELSALPGRVFKPSTALYLFFLPVADTVWIYVRRMIIARAPFSPGRDHIHHLVMERFSPRMTTWILVGFSGLLAGGAYTAERLGVDNSVLILTWMGLFLAYGAVTQRAWLRAWKRSHRAETVDGVTP